LTHTDRFWILLARKLSGEVSAEELRELEELLRTHPDGHFTIQMIAELWQQHPKTNLQELEASYDRHLERMGQTGAIITPHHAEHADQPAYLLEGKRKNFFPKYMIWTLGIGLLVGSAWVLYSELRTRDKEIASPSPTTSEVSTDNGSRSNLRLPDGTQVWLNAGTRLKYNKTFGSDNREVELSGEAFFDVVENSKLPFIIHTQQIEIRVLGTSFNVKCYPGDFQTETSLIRGKVEVKIRNRSDEKIILQPNEKLIVLNNDSVEYSAKKKKATVEIPIVSLSKLTYRSSDSLIIETAWTQNKLAFDNESFAEIAEKMKRWYGVEFEFRDEKKENIRFSGTFTNETIREAMDYLSMTAKFRYSIENNKIIISN
jgi:transmembrane sensor